MSKIDTIISEYRAYLERRHLAKAKHIPYFVNWARQFLAFAKEHHGKTFDEVYALFGESLGKNAKIGDWQIRQALDAVRIYGYQFRELSLSTQSHDNNLAAPLNLCLVIRSRESLVLSRRTRPPWTPAA